MRREDFPLQVKVSKGVLQIQIGIETLEWASREEHGGPLSAPWKVDPKFRKEWAQDVAHEMLREDEEGTTLLHRFLDEMMEEAANHGSQALICNAAPDIAWWCEFCLLPVPGAQCESCGETFDE